MAAAWRSVVAAGERTPRMKTKQQNWLVAAVLAALAALVVVMVLLNAGGLAFGTRCNRTFVLRRDCIYRKKRACLEWH